MISRFYGAPFAELEIGSLEILNFLSLGLKRSTAGFEVWPQHLWDQKFGPGFLRVRPRLIWPFGNSSFHRCFSDPGLSPRAACPGIRR